MKFSNIKKSPPVVAYSGELLRGRIRGSVWGCNLKMSINRDLVSIKSELMKITLDMESKPHFGHRTPNCGHWAQIRGH